MADSVASLPISLDLDLSTFNKKLLQAQKSMGTILSDIPERVSPKGRFRGMASGDFIKASTYREKMKNWVKTYQEAPEKAKSTLVNSALSNVKRYYSSSTPSQVTKTFENMFKDIGVEMPKSVKAQSDKWKKQENDRIAREKKDTKNNEKQTQEIGNISRMLFKGVLGFGARLTPYAIATKAAVSAVQGLNNIYSTRAVYGREYSRSMEAAAQGMVGESGERLIKGAYAQYADFKPMMDMGIVNTDMIKRVALATRKNPEALNLLMKGDTNGFINSVINQASGMSTKEARAMFSVLGLDVEGAMKLRKQNQFAGGNLFQAMTKTYEEKGQETAWEDFAEGWELMKAITRTGVNFTSALAGNVGNTARKNAERENAGKVVIQELKMEVKNSEEAAKTVDNLSRMSNIEIIKSQKTH